MQVKRIFILAALMPVLSACSIVKFGDDGREDYSRAAAVKALEAPSGLVAPGQLSKAYSIPGEGGDAVAPMRVTDLPVLPEDRRLRLEKSGQLYWLSTTIEPTTLWPHLQNFWKVRGIDVERSFAQKGTIYTAKNVVKDSNNQELRHAYTLRVKPASYRAGGHTKVGSRIYITAQ